MDAMENDDFAMLGGWSTRGSKGTQRRGGDPPYGRRRIDPNARKYD